MFGGGRGTKKDRVFEKLTGPGEFFSNLVNLELEYRVFQFWFHQVAEKF